MSDNAELHGKLLSFLAGEFARKEGRQCVRVDLLYAPGGGFREEDIRKWVRADQPELFENFANVEQLVSQIIEIATGEADAKPAGKHRFVVKTLQHHNERATHSFALSPTYTGSGDETALVPSNGAAGRNDQTVIASHAAALMRINAGMFDGTIRVLGAQTMNLHEQVKTLTAENAVLRHDLEEARSNKMDREFQIAMAAEKNERTNAGFQKLLQIGTVVAAKIGGGGGEEGQGGGGSSSQLGMLIGDFAKSLRQDQIGVLMNALDLAQKMMFFEIMNIVNPAKDKPGVPPTPGGPH